MSLFGTAGIRGSISEITPELAARVGRAAANDAGSDSTFVVGRDGRTSGPALARAVAAGLESGGATVELVGELPTPALAFASRGRRGIMVTASHNPPTDNGFKLFRDGVEYDDAAEARIESLVDAGADPVAWSEWTGATAAEGRTRYRNAVVSYATSFGDDAEGMRIAVDCGNGVTGPILPAVLRSVGATVGALNASVDGHEPARASKPTAESLGVLREFVADGPWIVGFGFDGDGDRIVVVDRTGEVVHEDTVLAILAETYVGLSRAPNPVVVTTPNASGRIDERVQEAGGRTRRIGLGALHEGIEEVRSAGATVAFAAEPWKHIHPGFGGWIDAIASAAVLTRLFAESNLETRRAPINERPYRKRSLPCPDAAKESVMGDVGSTLTDRFPAASASDDHGIRLTFPDDSWLLVRPSGTEPRIRLYAESDDVEDLLDEAVELIESVINGT